MSQIIKRLQEKKEEIMMKVGQRIPAVGERRSSPLPIVKNVKAKLRTRFPAMANRPMMNQMLSNSASPSSSPGSWNPAGLEQQFTPSPPPITMPEIEKVKTVNKTIMV